MTGFERVFWKRLEEEDGTAPTAVQRTLLTFARHFHDKKQPELYRMALQHLRGDVVDAADLPKWEVVKEDREKIERIRRMR